MVLWLFAYVAGFFVSMAVVACVAHVRRSSHEMPRRTVVQLTLSAGVVWPLLAVAGVQVVLLLTLKAALGLVRRGDDDALAAVDAPAVPLVQPLAVAAA